MGLTDENLKFETATVNNENNMDADVLTRLEIVLKRLQSCGLKMNFLTEEIFAILRGLR